MATKEELHVGDYGTSFEVQFRKAHDNSILDISGATAKNLLFRHPDGTIDAHAGSFITDGSDGWLKYVTSTGDINQAGLLEYRGEVTLSGAHYETSTKTVTVYSRWTS